ncbi:MAG: aminotransferase class III-fold pyridoxal phosphate-dependent enzyme [Actinomycetota bacterium]|nr:aminotransferase class III-fold pyridoxal phosphate-dependent enzyme [Actinomycetota bacterium]
MKERALRVIPSCTQTFSKGPTQFVQGAAPVFIAEGAGSHVLDVDGNSYIDYSMGLGAVILGHGYPGVVDRVTAQLSRGIAHSLPHPLEVELAETIVDIVPCAEMVRFAKNGSDATAGAIRAARAFTMRDLIACCGYHGWQDWFIGTTTRAAGVPEAVRSLTIPFRFNDLPSLDAIVQAHGQELAAVILEPVGVEKPEEGFLQDVADLSSSCGSLLIFDEIVSGFRLSLEGAQGVYGVVPDMACYGKAVANGFPLSFVAGRQEVMEVFDEIFFSFTFGGDAASLAAALAVVETMRDGVVLEKIRQQGQSLMDGYNEISSRLGISNITTASGYPARHVLTFAGEDALVLKSYVQQEALKRGVLFVGFHNLCYQHDSADIQFTLSVYDEVLRLLKDAIEEGSPIDRLDGPPVEPVFRQP